MEGKGHLPSGHELTPRHEAGPQGYAGEEARRRSCPPGTCSAAGDRLTAVCSLGQIQLQTGQCNEGKEQDAGGLGSICLSRHCDPTLKPGTW